MFPAARFSDLKAASDAMRVIADGWDMILPDVSPGRRRGGLMRAGLRAASSTGQCYPYFLAPN